MSLVFTSRYRNCNNISKPLTQTYGGKRRTKIAETVMMSGKVFFYLPKKKKNQFDGLLCYDPFRVVGGVATRCFKFEKYCITQTNARYIILDQ